MMTHPTRRQSLALLGAAALTGTVGLARPGRAQAAPETRNPEKNPGLIFDKGPAGWWDSERVSCPRPLIEPDGSWKMWYYGRDPSFTREINMPTGRIGLATSADGISWHRVRGPGVMGAVLDPGDDPDAFDSGHLGVGEVKRVEAGYEMLYFGGSARGTRFGARTIPGFPMQPGRATSTDGINWEKHPGPLLEAGPPGSFDAFNVAWPQIVALPGGGQRMYYHTLHPVDRFMICAADSEDGVSWEKRGPILKRGPEGRFDEGGCASRHVIRWQGSWLMIYEAFDDSLAAAIGLATSDDGLDWQRLDGPLAKGAVFRTSEDQDGWDAGGVGTPWLVPMGDGSLRMYYVGINNADHDSEEMNELAVQHRIGLAVSADGDPARLARYS